MMPSSAKKMMLVSGRAFPALADEVAACLGIMPTPTKLFDFANGEIFVRFMDSVRGCDVFVLQSHTSPINEWIMEQLIMVDALNRASARRITVVTPFFGYARQDKKNRGREPISARLMADMIDTGATIAKAAEALFEQGADRVIATATHGVLSGAAVDILKNSRISEIIITNTLPVPQEKRFNKLTVLSIAPLLARAISEVFSDGSVTSLFDGQS